MVPKEIKSVNPKGNQPWMLERLDDDELLEGLEGLIKLKLQIPGYLELLAEE